MSSPMLKSSYTLGVNHVELQLEHQRDGIKTNGGKKRYIWKSRRSVICPRM